MIFRGLDDWHELQIDDGPIEAMITSDLMDRLLTTDVWNMVDFLECVSQALKSYREGDRDSWIIFPSGAKRSRASS